ncbi:substrate-binding periplasmic protein [Zooshikella harenae]|uniref:Transporter substrate-binding domain-containing protein n=1 Tax=Zooshikella harenae TaxID=2827238 RepID=A0ABS5ZHL4_9GAMM|nr:transporter substrate-binding domain-containing protein [Zooshikella harenae]MBU2713420.1 transporter substrate-binding domain-containing protein [Zooshikella harenae]
MWKIVYSITFLFLVLQYAQASVDGNQFKEKEYQVILGPVPGYTDSLKKGPGSLLTQEIISRLEKDGYKFQLRIVPWARANKLFNSGKVDVLFPELILDDSQKGMTGMPVDMASQVVFNLKGRNKINSIEELYNKKIVFVRGIMKISELLHPSIDLIEVNAPDQAFKMLRKKRADAYVNWLTLDNYNRESFQYGKAIVSRFDAYRFQISNEGAKLMELFNFSFGMMIKDGTYNKIFHQYKVLNILMTQPEAAIKKNYQELLY